ncbi:MAG: hypothetical protein KAT65_13655 [Methanophagales archaeon]|nr:hypothetical protein [Methanophagales archaeon]
MREILVCVTFREFDGSTNAKIQEKFLEGLQKQSYSKFRLIVTNYREKQVKNELNKSELPYEFHQSEKDCLCSWTEVIQNSFQYLKKGQHIILWTNADNVFEPNLFSEIINNFESGSGGTSYPHIPYVGLENFERKRPWDTWKNRPLRSFFQLDANYWVPDTIWIDGDLLLDLENQKLFMEHEFRDRWPGMAQTLVLAFYANKLKNLFFKSKIAMISNVRAETQTVNRLKGGKQVDEEEAKRIWCDHFREEDQRGYDTLMKFCKAKGIDKKFICHPLEKLNQHRKYKVVGRVDQKLFFMTYFSYWFCRCSVRPYGNYIYKLLGLKRRMR